MSCYQTKCVDIHRNNSSRNRNSDKGRAIVRFGHIEQTGLNPGRRCGTPPLFLSYFWNVSLHQTVKNAAALQGRKGRRDRIRSSSHCGSISSVFPPVLQQMCRLIKPSIYHQLLPVPPDRTRPERYLTLHVVQQAWSKGGNFMYFRESSFIWDSRTSY